MYYFLHVIKGTCGNYNKIVLGEVTQKVDVLFAPSNIVYTHIRMFLYNVVAVLNKRTTTISMLMSISKMTSDDAGPSVISEYDWR